MELRAELNVALERCWRPCFITLDTNAVQGITQTRIWRSWCPGHVYMGEREVRCDGAEQLGWRACMLRVHFLGHCACGVLPSPGRFGILRYPNGYCSRSVLSLYSFNIQIRLNSLVSAARPSQTVGINSLSCTISRPSSSLPLLPAHALLSLTPPP